MTSIARCAIGCSLITFAATSVQAADAADADSTEIVVTANKRDEKLKDIAGAITAIGSEKISTLGIQDFHDYANLTPGLSQRDFGQPGTGTVILRGLNTGAQQTQATAAFYIDETLFTTSGFLGVGALLTPSPDLGDVERIEVLKGPQGTLYGANSLGGVIKIVNKDPDATKIEANARAEYTAIDAGGDGYSVRSSVNMPIVADKLAVRASGFYRDAPGWTTNTGTGARNVNTSESYGGRISLRATPTERLAVELTGIYQDINNIGSALQDNVTGMLTPRTGRYQYNNFADLPAKLKYLIGSGKVDYDFGPVSLVTTVSYAEYRTNIDADYTEAYLPLLGGLVPDTAKLLGNLSPNTKKWTAESRLVSERLGRVEFVAGVFYTHESSEYKTTIEVLDGTPPVPIGGFFGELFRASSNSKYEEIAGYANATYYLTDAFDVTGGIRYSHNNDTSTTGAPLDGIPASSFYRPRPATSFSSSDNPVTWLATLRWRPTSTISTYLRAASGYRPGGAQTNANPPPGAQSVIKSDSVWNYEGGIKGSALDGAFQFDIAAYHIDWKDIQLSTIFGGTVLQGNGGQGKVDGVEANFGITPVRNFTIGTAFGYTNARLTQIDPQASASIGAVAGDKLPLTPRLTMAVLADASLPLSDKATASFGGTVRLQSDMPSGFPGDPLNPNIRIPAYETVDLRAGIKYDRYNVQLRVDNLFNTFGYTSLATNAIFAGQTVPTQGTVIRPRSFTLSVGASF